MDKTPHQLADELHEMAIEYAKLAEELGMILTYKPAEWLKLRGDSKSDASTDRAYEATEAGTRETIIRLKMKALEKMMSAIKTKLQILTNEARSNY